MLARASSDAGARVRRSKSTSNVHRRPPSVSEPPHPDLAQQQALVAATTAFARAQTNNVSDYRPVHGTDLARSKSNASRKSISSQGSHFPPRDSSLRSLQRPPTGTTQGVARQAQVPPKVTEQFPPLYPLPTNDRPPSAPRPLSAQPSITFTDQRRPASQSKMQRSSASSSITSQQIRKARSMYYASSVQTGSPIARPPAKYLVTPRTTSPISVTEQTPALPARPVRPSPLVPPRVPVIVRTNETIDQARDKYLQTFQKKTVKHKPSALLAPFKKRQDKSKDKDDRISSGASSVPSAKRETPNASNVDVTLTEILAQSGPKEKRSFSGSLKSRIKKVFRRTSTRAPTLPVQQIEASRDYFEETYIDHPPSAEIHDIPSPDDDTLQRVRARTPSFEGVRPLFNRASSRTSSNGSSKSNRSTRSLHSEANAMHVSSSRITSWGTNSTSDTLTQRAMKRLTVIHEAKDSIGSETDRVASMVSRRKSLPPMAAFRDPMPMESLVEEHMSPVDPKRVFSALMREIDASSSSQVGESVIARTPGADSDVFESSVTKEMHTVAGRSSGHCPSSDQRLPSYRPGSAAAHSTRSKTSTIRSLGKAVRTTIRTVTPVAQHQATLDKQTRPSSRLSNEDDTRKDLGNSGRYEENSASFFTPSAAQLEKRKEKSDGRWKTPLEDAGTVYFPRETKRTYDVTDFAKHESQISDETVNLDPAMGNSATHGAGRATEDTKATRGPRSPLSPADDAAMSPLSPSIYSRNTDGLSIMPNESVVSFDGPHESGLAHNSGSAVVLASQSVRSYVIGTPSPRRPNSTRTSRDWKAWLSHEISGMESISQENLKIQEQYVTPTRKRQTDVVHSSQTDEEDTTVILRGLHNISTPQRSATMFSTSEPRAHHDRIEDSTSDTVLPASQETGSLAQVDSTVPMIHSTDEASSAQQAMFDSRPDTIASRLQRLPSTPSSGESSSRFDLEASNSGHMNDRFPYINKARRTSNLSARSSRHSKSPTDSIVSLISNRSSGITQSGRAYSRVSVVMPQGIPPRLPNTSLKRSDAMHKRKENITPPSVRGIGKLNPSSPTASASQYMSQPLATITPQQKNSNTPNHVNNSPGPAATPLRPRVRASLRPMSPEKLARRPRSAFDLRGTARTLQGPMTLYQTNIPELQVAPQRPCTELRRPGSHLTPSTTSLAQAKEPSPVLEERAIDSVIDEHGGSVTPGQRMVDRYLKERKSTGVLDGVRMRGGLRLTREDTPAFL